MYANYKTIGLVYERNRSNEADIRLRLFYKEAKI